MPLSAKFLVEQLRRRMTEDAAIAARAGQTAMDAAQHSATAMEKREDSRTMIEYGNLANAQALRVRAVQEAVATLDAWVQRGLPRYSDASAIGLGAIIEAASEDDDGYLGRTFVMLPVGAGEELCGPGGDGAITVVTPSSPVGKVMLGKRVGDVAEVLVRGEPVEWEIVEVTC
jgi:transcription elongation GreA/GreB family factor